MSLFTDPELPPPMPKSDGPASDSDTESDIWEQEVPRSKRCCLVRASTSYKGIAVLAVVGLVSTVMILYARERVQTIMAQAFFHSYIAGESAQNVQEQNAAIPPVLQLQQDSSQLHGKERNEDEDDEDEDDNEMPDDPDEIFPEEALSSEEEDGSYLLLEDVMADFKPMPDMILHYLWCGNRFFDFRNYLAIKSAIEAIQPKEVMFHYNSLPMVDPDGYFSWFQTLMKKFPNIVMDEVNSTQSCYSGGYKRFVLVFDFLRRYGGIYIPEDSIFVRLHSRFQEMNFVSGIMSCNLKFFFEGVALARKGKFEIPETEKMQVRKLSVCHDKNSLHPCTPESRYLQSAHTHVPNCVRLSSPMFPKDIWAAHDKLSKLAKLIAYGQETDLQPRRNPQVEYKTPRMAHYLCTDDCSLSFSVFLSILSALHVGGLESVLIHGPRAPSGVWWDTLQRERADVIHYLHRDFSFADDPKLEMTSAMQRYIMRTEILMHYGGVYHDSHVLWTQRLPDHLLEYDTVVSPDWHAFGSWPESINHALLISRGGAQYLEQLLQMYRENADSDSPWFADHYLSYRLIELDPTLVYLSHHLQVKCLNHNCHPTWHPGYRSHFLLNRPGPEFDWRTDTLSVHWVDSFPELDVDQVKFTSGFIVDIARHILEASGLDINNMA